MKKIKFHKMEGLGNDYVYVDARQGQQSIEDAPALSIKVSDRHFGIGSDGLVLIMDSEVADFRMRMFNADGSEAGMCGNAARCVGRYLYDLDITSSTEISLETPSGIKILLLEVVDGEVKSVTVDMEEPALEAAQIPVNSETPQQVAIEVDGKEYVFTCVNMGNPHAVTYVEDVANFPVEQIGKQIENHPLFPERTNVEFVEVLSATHLNMRVWERGSGETLACGTGACAVLVASHLNQKSERKAKVSLLGGDVEVTWVAQTNRVLLAGAATWVFEGVYFDK